jgi:hypothetical protein
LENVQKKIRLSNISGKMFHMGFGMIGGMSDIPSDGSTSAKNRPKPQGTVQHFRFIVHHFDIFVQHGEKFVQHERKNVHHLGKNVHHRKKNVHHRSQCPTSEAVCPKSRKIFIAAGPERNGACRLLMAGFQDVSIAAARNWVPLSHRSPAPNDFSEFGNGNCNNFPPGPVHDFFKGGQDKT